MPLLSSNWQESSGAIRLRDLDLCDDLIKEGKDHRREGMVVDMEKQSNKWEENGESNKAIALCLIRNMEQVKR